jgi:hypothetical protein
MAWLSLIHCRRGPDSSSVGAIFDWPGSSLRVWWQPGVLAEHHEFL